MFLMSLISCYHVASRLQAMKRESNDVKALSAQCVTYVAQTHAQPLEDATVRAFVPALVNGTKERNTLVKTNSELALVTLLRMRRDESTLQVRPPSCCESARIKLHDCGCLQDTLESLDPGMRDSLRDVVPRLKKVAQQTEKKENIDDTWSL